MTIWSKIGVWLYPLEQEFVATVSAGGFLANKTESGRFKMLLDCRGRGNFERISTDPVTSVDPQFHSAIGVTPDKSAP